MKMLAEENPVKHIIISFHPFSKGDTWVILEYYPVGSMILEYSVKYAQELNDTKMAAWYSSIIEPTG